MPGNLVWEHSCSKAGSHSALVHKGIGFQIIPFATSGCFEALKGDVWHFWAQTSHVGVLLRHTGTAYDHQDSPPHPMCWSGVQIKQKTKEAQRARSSQNISLCSLQIIPGTANLIRRAQACPCSGLLITTFQFSRLRAGICIIREEVSNPPRKTKLKQTPTNFQTSIHEACELTSMMMMMMMVMTDDDDDVSWWHLLSPSSLCKAGIYYMPVLVMHFSFPWHTVRILVTVSASIAVLFMSLCKCKCVWTSFSVHYLPCPWFIFFPFS